MDTRVLDNDKRIFEAWGSVEIVDKDGELIPIEELEKVMPILMDRGGYIIDQHTNRVVGKILNYEIKEHPETGKKGVFIRGKIFDDYELDDEVWEEIKSGKRTGLSFGGRSKKQEIAFSFDSKQPVKILQDIEGYEFSVVDKPANPLATFEWVNPIAKMEIQKPFAGFKDFDDCIRQMKEKEGYDEDTARKVCGKIYWQTEGKEKYAEKTYEQFVNKPEDERPPKRWWENCIDRASSWADDPASVCGALWYHPERFIGGEKMREAYGKGGVSLTEEKKQEEQSLEARIASLEKKVQELEQKLAPVEEVTETAKEGDIGTTQINPNPEGGQVVLPKAVAEKKPAEAETDQTKIMEKFEKLEKQVEEITKSLSKLKVVSTPRTEEEEPTESEEIKNPAWEIIQKARKGDRVSMLDIKEMIAKQRKKELERINA